MSVEAERGTLRRLRAMNALHRLRPPRPTWQLSRLLPWRALGVLALAELPGCTETALDATLLQTDEPPIMTDAPKCVSPEPQLEQVYLIASKPTGRCLRSGEVTDIEGAAAATGYTIELVDCTGASDQEWLLLGTANQMHIQHVDLGLNLDLEAGSLYEGTEALLYEPHGGRNQTFSLHPLSDDSQEIRAFFSDNGCLEAMRSSENAVELQGCPNVVTRIFPYQNWFFSEVDCDE
jgi:hypothetical protein